MSVRYRSTDRIRTVSSKVPTTLCVSTYVLNSSVRERFSIPIAPDPTTAILRFRCSAFMTGIRIWLRWLRIVFYCTTATVPVLVLRQSIATSVCPQKATVADAETQRAGISGPPWRLTTRGGRRGSRHKRSQKGTPRRAFRQASIARTRKAPSVLEASKSGAL